MTRNYFTEQDARMLIGRRVQARVALSRHWLRDLGLWIGSGSHGTVTQLAFGSQRDEFLVGVHWDDPRPAIPRLEPCPIDWYTEDEYRALLGVPVEGEYPSAGEAGRPQGAVRRHCEAGRAPKGCGVIRRWVNYGRGRYYIAVVTDDLFGGWNLQRFWGGCDAMRGGQLSQHLDDPEAIEEQLRRIANRRRQRDYIDVRT